MLGKKKSLSIRDLLVIVYPCFFLFVFVIVSLFVFVYIDVLNASNASKKMQAEMDTENIYINNHILKDINIIQNFCQIPELLLSLREYPAADMFQQLEIETSVSKQFTSFIYSNPEIFQGQFYLPGKKYSYSVSQRFKDISVVQNSPQLKEYLNLNCMLFADMDFQPLYENDSKRCLSMLFKITDNDNNLLGYLIVEIERSYFSSLYLSKYNNEYIISNTGKTIFPSGNKAASLPDSVMKKILAQNSFGEYSYRINSTEYIVYASSSNDQGWKQINIFRKSDVYNWRTFITTVCLILCGFIVCIILAFARQIKMHISQPLYELSRSMLISEKVPDTSGNYTEIHQLNSCYNKLLDKQAELIEDIIQKTKLKKEADLQSLIAQMNPHFMFNALNAIGYCALEAEHPEICSMISKLSKLYKLNYNINLSENQLKDEIVHISLYMDLQKECFHNKFDYEINVPQEFLNLRVPKFILQPLVENSILHGFHHIYCKGKIVISASADTNLEIIVRDNGCGIDSATLNELNERENDTSKHYGIFNINKRLDELYGKEYGITFKSNGTSYTIAKIVLPYVPPQQNVV